MAAILSLGEESKWFYDNKVQQNCVNIVKGIRQQESGDRVINLFTLWMWLWVKQL